MTWRDRVTWPPPPCVRLVAAWNGARKDGVRRVSPRRQAGAAPPAAARPCRCRFGRLF